MLWKISWIAAVYFATMSQMNVTGIFIHPIKSCQRLELEQAEVTPLGFVRDREFMLVDRNNRFMTQREYPQMARIKVQCLDDFLLLSVNHQHIQPLKLIPNWTGSLREVQIWRDQTQAIDQGDEVAAWFQTALELKDDQICRLVRQSPQYIRRVNPKYAVKSENAVSFADGYPFLLTNTASLDELNRRLQLVYPEQNQTIPMIRFRPNLVVEATEPFIEDQWKLIQIGAVIFHVVKPCDRCMITTTDQSSGVRDKLKEPLKTLATFRRQPNGILFGQNLIPQNTGIVRTGDEVKIIETQ